MLRSISEIMGYKLEARDGDIGRCKDFLFDDRRWTVRYVVAETGGWLSDRKTLISPIALDGPDWGSRRLRTRLDRKSIENAPPLDEDAPVSRQYEMKYHAHYGWPHYWRGTGIWAADAYPQPLYDDVGQSQLAVEDEEVDGDPHLRSMDEVIDYRLEAQDGKIGHVGDFIIDDETWQIRYVIADTRKWLSGKRVLLSPSWIRGVHWGEQRVAVDLTREEVKNSPEFKPSEPVNREYEMRLYDYYGRPRYW
jgi:hypothetical protein